jgi:hypothetical protein
VNKKKQKVFAAEQQKKKKHNNSPLLLFVSAVFVVLAVGISVCLSSLRGAVVLNTVLIIGLNRTHGGRVIVVLAILVARCPREELKRD